MTHFTTADWTAIKAHEDTDLDGPAADSAIEECERAVGASLPASLKELLRRSNGGVLGGIRLFGVDRSDALDLRRQIEENRPEFEETSAGAVLPFASDWGGSYFCFDLREPDPEYPVLYWNHEYAENPEDRPLIWSRFADNFVAFVRRVIE